MRLETKQAHKVPELKLLKTLHIAEEIKRHLAIQDTVQIKPVLSIAKKETSKKVAPTKPEPAVIEVRSVPNIAIKTAPKKPVPAVVAERPAPKIVQKRQIPQPVKQATPHVPRLVQYSEPVMDTKNYQSVIEPELSEPTLIQEHQPYLTQPETTLYDISDEPVEMGEGTTKKLFQIPSQPEQYFQESTSEKPDLAMLQIELPFLIIPTEAETPLDWQPATAETEQPPSITEHVTEYIETLEPAKAEEAKAILDIVLEKIFNLEDSGLEFAQDPEVAKQELEILCTRLLVCMGAEPTPELVKQFILLLKEEHRMQQEVPVQLNWDEGTHERKQPVDFFPDNSQPARTFSDWLGIYALRLAVPQP